MIIYVESKSFPQKSFVTLVKPGDKIARIRGQILHILDEIGRIDHQFRLRYKDQFLRDAYTLDDYDIKDKAVVHMVSMSRKNESLVDLRSESNSEMSIRDTGSGQTENIKASLREEVGMFERRERLVLDFKTLQYVHSLATVLCVFTLYWYSVFWTGALFLFGVFYSPNYTRVAGFVGSTIYMRKVFCVVYGIAGILTLSTAIVLSSMQWLAIQSHGCADWELTGSCSAKTIFTAVFFTVLAMITLLSDIIVWVLFWNFKYEVGDIIEKYLVQECDIEKVMSAARFGKLKEKRTAAYELATMAASGDDNKFRIVAEGGLDVLNAMALGRDEATQEHAVEALAELLTIPSIQDSFVETGGVRTLSALLHSPYPRVMQDAAMALYNIVSDSEENKGAVIQDHGLEDLAHAAHKGTISCQRIVASIYLDLAFNSEVRVQMAARTIPAQALTQLCRSSDVDSQRFSLQTLELLAIESPDLIYAQEELLVILLGIPLVTMDERLYLLAGKILLYYSENPEWCERMLDEENLKECLGLFTRTKDSVLQKVVAKIIFSMLETKQSRLRARELKLDHILSYIKANPADRESWDMADQGLQAMSSSEDSLVDLPSLTTLEKLDKMGVTMANFGSRTSVRSDQSSLSSIVNKKGLNKIG